MAWLSAGCLNSLGIPARSIGLKTKDVETRDYVAGHVATEAYLKDYRKWVFIDGQWGLIPLMGDMPLNAIQLSEVIQHPEDYEEALQFLSFLGENGAQEGRFFDAASAGSRTSDGISNSLSLRN